VVRRRPCSTEPAAKLGDVFGPAVSMLLDYEIAA
jgi:hypothetical protein